LDGRILLIHLDGGFYYKALIKPERIFDISVVKLFITLNFSLFMYDKSLAKYNIERTSAHEPLAIYRKYLKSLLELLS